MIPARGSCRYGDGSDFKNGLRKNVGLDLGRRLLVVLKTAKVDETQAIRVVDHGEQQKEALRRLYDAQVLLQSYEDQLCSKDEQLQSIMACVKKAIRQTNGDAFRDPVLVRSLGLSEEELQEEGIVTMEQKGGGRLARFDARPDQAFENQKWEEQQDRDRKAREMQEVTGGLSTPASPQNGGPEHELNWFKIPYWLKGDEETRAIVHNMKQHFIDEMNAKGHFDHNMFQEHLWQCGLQVAQRWAGVPNQELIKQAEVAEQKARQIQRESLQETSMLRQHIKRVERKYKELQGNVGKMQKAMSTMASQLMEAREALAMYDVELSPPHEAERRPSIYAMPASPGAQGHLIPPQAAGKAGSVSSPSSKQTPHGRASIASDTPALVDISQSIAFAQQGPGCVSPLHGDDTLDMPADQAQLQEMDNEIYEPLNQFDADLRDLMMDCITEKVRRILSLDPSKYKNGRLPFGLKPDKGVALTEGADLEEEVERLREIIERLKEENDQLNRQLEAARAAAERWKAKFMELQEKLANQPKVETKVEVEAPPVQPVETPKQTREEPVPVVQGVSDEEVKRLLAEQEKAYKAKIAALEKRIKDLENELKKLKEENEKLKAKADDAKNLAEQERQKRLSERQLMEEQNKKDPEPKPVAPDNTAALDEARKAAKHFEKLAEEMKLKAAAWMEATRNAAELALRGFTKVSSITGHKVPKDELKFLQAFATAADPVASDVGKFMKDSSPKFEVWVSEALKKYEASFSKEAPKAPTPEAPREVATPEPKEKVKEVVYKGDPKEILHLKQVTQRQQEEISRLLLTIDELRKRLENIRVVSMDAGPGVASSVDNIMEKVGLKDIMDPSFTSGIPRAPPVLKGVFERLYSDAIQRIQRFGLIRQQMLLANKTYASIVDTISTDFEDTEKKIPDFDSLNDTTDSTIKGMWYQTEYLFRRACEYAMSQGVEASLVKAQQSLVSEFEVEDNFERTRHEAPRKERTHVRRSERPVARGKEEGSAPPKAQKDDQQTPFMNYMAALREAHGEVNDDAKEKTERKRQTGDSNFPRTLKAACSDRSGQSGLATSHSLPALPKGRSLFQVDDGVSPHKAKFSSLS